MSASVPEFANPSWVQAHAQDYCFANPTAPPCEAIPGIFDYAASLPANAAFLGVFAASLLGFAAAWAATRRAASFNAALLAGLACEVVGYAGRVLAAGNRWHSDAFLMQICTLTIGPAFFAAGIYLCLRQVVVAFGAGNSRVAPVWYTRVFIPCDVVSLILQAAGGALASIANKGDSSIALGTNIMLAGLVSQVATMVVFVGASLDFGLRTWRRCRSVGAGSALDQDPALVAVRATRRFTLFLAALALSAVCVLARSAFRVAELSEGFSGPIAARQDLFIGFEGVLVVVAVLSLNVFHPAWCMGPVVERTGGFQPFGRRRRSRRRESGRDKGEPEVAVTPTSLKEAETSNL